jgi:redox-regulated HSP33 family molecular chaperone
LSLLASSGQKDKTKMNPYRPSVGLLTKSSILVTRPLARANVFGTINRQNHGGKSNNECKQLEKEMVSHHDYRFVRSRTEHEKCDCNNERQKDFSHMSSIRISFAGQEETSQLVSQDLRSPCCVCTTSSRRS